MKRYKAIFFDWDGTAVITRDAPTDQIMVLLQHLLAQGVVLVIISGTTYKNIALGKLHDHLADANFDNLFMGLGRGAYNYGFQHSSLVKLHEIIPENSHRRKLHTAAFRIHQFLLENFNYETDIVFSRPNYCKIDLLVNLDRGGKLYFQASELDWVNQNLEANGFQGGMRTLLDKAVAIGRKTGLDLKATTDAKYLEIGMTTKADNIDWLLQNIVFKRGIQIGDCCFWGDEFTFLGPGVPGSDAMMITERSRLGDFYDVSESPMALPPKVTAIGGGPARFLEFLNSQIQLEALNTGGSGRSE
jgi:hypothetical protein